MVYDKRSDGGTIPNAMPYIRMSRRWNGRPKYWISFLLEKTTKKMALSVVAKMTNVSIKWQSITRL